MKMGDQKQAIALGIVAVFAVGMLCKTALGAFGGNNANAQVVVKDIGGTGERLPETKASESDERPLLTKENAPDQTQPANVTTIKRDAFDRPKLPEGTKPFGSLIRPSVSPETSNPTGELPPAPLTGTVNGGGVDPSLPKPETKISGNDSDAKHLTAPKEVGVLTRFDGCVEAGSSMGIVSVNGESFSVAIGDLIGSGYKVEAISNQKITIRKGKVVKTIYIGKETRI